ncbi:serine/threonine-protein kinase [Asanoa siamensis]|uniref:non-specific serine/threonine protein kinase n=1 Tax=Asanoa siamensis TaxID=926357 RepID=A0ABQ4CRF1_9ACTN|nr:serine/threonine-protein kinase [Asanoa siamensis]GIF73879.1 serine/threonine-protein kinase PknA [Asanoa siamensis]
MEDEVTRLLGGRYRLERRIAMGGAAEVWRGRDEMLGRTVAVKVMHGDADDPATPDDLVFAEARAVAALAHPNVAEVFDVGVCPPLRYIVMEFADGRTLAQHLRAGALDWRIAVRVCAEVSAALAAAHVAGLVHRDVKPANVILTPYGAKVLDFGISVLAGSDDRLADGTITGTPAFMAPERFRGLPAAPATDMYALGVLLYLCLTGRLPFPPPPRNGDVIAPPALLPVRLPAIPDLPAEVADVCLSCLDPEPDPRPTSFAAALLLAEAADARVHLPPLAALPEDEEPTSPWTSAAAEAPTDIGDTVRDGAAARLEEHSRIAAGRHRAD